jgi:transcriptional regulator GlxA family with amidase domain
MRHFFFSLFPKLCLGTVRYRAPSILLAEESIYALLEMFVDMSRFDIKRSFSAKLRGLHRNETIAELELAGAATIAGWRDTTFISRPHYDWSKCGVCMRSGSPGRMVRSQHKCHKAVIFCHIKMRRMAIRPRVIAFLVAPPFELLNLTGPASVFSQPKLDGKQCYSVKLLSTQPGSDVYSTSGISLSTAVHYLDYTGPIDTLIAIGGLGSMERQPPEVLQWVRKRSVHVNRVASVCTGAFILAAAGVLDGRRVTTHWRHIDELIERHRHLRVERDPIYIRDGKVYTTAGVSAGIDLALALIEEDHGQAVAANVAREIVLFLRRPGNQAQYSTLLAQQADVSGTPLRDLPAWANSRLTQKLDVSALAKVVAMTPRTFARQFELHFRTTPARWVQSLRVEAARQHLEARELPLKGIVRITGFRDEQALRRAFLQQHSMTPKDYRDRFSAPAPN